MPPKGSKKGEHLVSSTVKYCTDSVEGQGSKKGDCGGILYYKILVNVKSVQVPAASKGECDLT